MLLDLLYFESLRDFIHFPRVEGVLKVFETDHDYGEVVEASFNRALLDNCVGHFSCDLVNGCIGAGLCLIESIPSDVKHVLVRQTIKDAITAQHNKVVEVWLHCKLGNLGLRNYHTFFASVF